MKAYRTGKSFHRLLRVVRPLAIPLASIPSQRHSSSRMTRRILKLGSLSTAFRPFGPIRAKEIPQVDPGWVGTLGINPEFHINHHQQSKIPPGSLLGRVTTTLPHPVAVLMMGRAPSVVALSLLPLSISLPMTSEHQSLTRLGRLSRGQSSRGFSPTRQLSFEFVSQSRITQQWRSASQAFEVA
jgi:hypothetical protein